METNNMYGDDTPKKPKKACPKCGRRLKTDQGVRNHLRDYHGVIAVLTDSGGGEFL